MSIHESVINLLVGLGYKKTEGCCHGFSLRWLEACFLDEEPLFDMRIQKIDSEGDALIHRIDAVKEKQGKNLTAQDNELLDILAFYDSLELYQFPHIHFSLFNAPLMQDDVEIISNFASSAAILSRGGLARIYSEPGIYTKKEIKAYFDDLGVVIEKASIQSKEPMGIVLSSHNHSIALTYTPGKGWKFMDINQYPSKSFMVNETNGLAECIMTGLMPPNSSYRAFNVSVFTTRKQVRLLNLKEPFDSFKTSHSLTKEIANREAGGIGLARIAAQYNHAPVIADLSKQGVDLNQADKEGITPAYIAAQNGNVSVIAELAKLEVDLNQAMSHGATPAFIAAQDGHTVVIAELIKMGVNVNTPYTASVDSLRQFANYRDDNLIERMNNFIKQQLTLLPARYTISMTPYDVAFVMGHREIMELLNKKEENTQKKRLSDGYQLMEHIKNGYDKRAGDRHTFFSPSVKENVDNDVLPEIDKKSTCYIL